MATKDPKPSKVPPHAFERDEELDREPYVPVAARSEREPRFYCVHCGLAGEVGDDRHPVDALPPADPKIAAEWKAHDQAVLGERDAFGGEVP